MAGRRFLRTINRGYGYLSSSDPRAHFGLGSAREYESIEQMQGSMSLAKTPNPGALIRANYMKVLDSWEV